MKILLHFLLVLFCSFSFAQDNSTPSMLEKPISIKPLRLGVRLGVPNLLTANMEYVTPLLNNRISATFDYMSLSKTIDDVSVKFSNFEIGTNIYLNPTGKGLYAGVSYFSFDGLGEFENIDFDDNTSGDGKGQIKFNTLNLKLGAKLGRIFYFRIEAGYGFGSIPEHIQVTSNATDAVATEKFQLFPE